MPHLDQSRCQPQILALNKVLSAILEIPNVFLWLYAVTLFSANWAKRGVLQRSH